MIHAVKSSSFSNPQSLMTVESKELTQQSFGNRRSKAIAIAKNRHDVDHHPDQTCSSMERMYDLATWRMFARITEHRRRFPIRPCTEDALVTARYMLNAPKISNESYETGTEKHPVSTDQDEHFFEGEIFEMEI
jgi:hypothetical protein